jgi:hypothetical protein
VEVRVCEISRVLAMAAFAAGCGRLFAQQCLAEPQREALFACAAGAVKQETGGKGIRSDTAGEACAELFMPVKVNDRHTLIWHVS